MKRRPSKGLPAPHNSGNRITAASVSSQWTGPLPPPEAMNRFNQVIPDGAERIFKMAEAEQAHRIALERDALQATVAEAKRGQRLGASISLLAVGGALVSVWLGALWAVSVALVGVPPMGLAKAIGLAIGTVIARRVVGKGDGGSGQPVGAILALKRGAPQGGR